MVAINTTAINTMRPLAETSNRCFIWNLAFTLSFARLFAEMPVDQVFDKFHAPEIHDLCTLFHTTIERHAHLPRSREYVRVLDGRFIQETIRNSGGGTF